MGTFGMNFKTDNGCPAYAVACELFKRFIKRVVGVDDEEDGKGKKVVYMLAWPDMEASRVSWKSFGADPDRKRIWADYNKDGDIVDHWEAVYLEPLDFSPLQ